MKEYCSVYNEEGYAVIDNPPHENGKCFLDPIHAGRDAIEKFLALDCNRNLKFNIVDVCDMKVNEFVYKRDILVSDADKHIVPKGKSNPKRRTRSGK